MYSSQSTFRRKAISASAVCTALLIMAGGVLLGVPGPAAATGFNCPGRGNHCYLIGTWFPQGNLQGAYGSLESDCLFISNWTAQNQYYANNSIWLATSNDPTWIEAGIAYGAQHGNYLYLYWAEKYPITGGTWYLEHDDYTHTASGGVTYFTDIYKTSTTSSNWSVVVSGPGLNWTGTSASNFTAGIYAETGTEYAGDSTDHFHTYSRSMQLGFADGAGNDHASWANSHGRLSPTPQPNTYAAIVTAGDGSAATNSHSTC